jgi:GNAT superfamily N-acetyltransferase
MRQPFSIRRAIASEREALEALQTRASLSNPGDRAALLANPDAIALPLAQVEAGQVFLAERAGAIIGFAAVLTRADGELELDGLFVDPALWRRGVGSALVDYAADYARKNGAAALHVVGNPHAAGFYAACGFESLGRQKTRFGEGLLLRKMLRP